MLEESLRQLCSSNKTYLGIFAMLCIILSAMLYAANFLVNSGRPKTAGKPRLWLAGTSLLAIAILCIIIYIIAPVVTNALLGPGDLNDPCNPNYAPSANYTPTLPYCGAYCHNQSIPKDYPDCQCRGVPLQQALPE